MQVSVSTVSQESSTRRSQLQRLIESGIMVDIDGTLTGNDFVNVYARFLGLQPLADLREQVTSYDLDMLFGATPEQANSFWGEPYIEACRFEIPQHLSVDVLRKIRQHCIPIHYVTARRMDTREVTYHWLMTKGYPAGKVVFEQHNKVDYVRETGLGLVIEDSAYQALTIAEAGIPVILIDWAYNRHVSHPLIYRVWGWDQVEQLIFNANLLPA